MLNISKSFIVYFCLLICIISTIYSHWGILARHSLEKIVHCDADCFAVNI